MKYIILLNIIFIWQAFTAQHNYSLMPNTININVVKPIPPAKPVDYAKLTANLTNTINDVAAKREAQRQIFENIKNDAINIVEKNQALGYSTTLNSMINNVKSIVLRHFIVIMNR